MELYFLKILAFWAGTFYLLNKIFFWITERSSDEEKQRRSRIACWIFYMIGLPAWEIHFVYNSNWIAFFVELAGLPSMILGLVNAIQKKEKEEPKLLLYIAIATTLIGICISVYSNRGFSEITQWFEVGIATGFLGGTILLAKKTYNIKGYLLFLILMHPSCALLMRQLAINNGEFTYNILAVQQLISMPFVLYAFINRKRKLNS